MKNLMAQIVRERKTHGMTQRELAHRIGCSENRIIAFESLRGNCNQLVLLDRVLRELDLKFAIVHSVHEPGYPKPTIFPKRVAPIPTFDPEPEPQKPFVRAKTLAETQPQ